MNVHDMAATVRNDLAGFVGDIERLETVFATWDETEQAAVGAYRFAIEALNGEALRRLIRDACPEITDIIQVKGLGGSEESGVRFVSPFALGSKGDWIAAGLLSDIPEGSVRSTVLGGEKVLLSRNGSTVTCFQNACAHLGFPIHDGEVENGIITCPHHGFQYDLSSGECLTAPEVQLQSHAVRVIGPRVEVRISA
jgi:nitrite reductase/ring-hydroxylating ferredoxin subunit